MIRSLLLLPLALSIAHVSVADAAEKPRQLLLVSFDGAHDTALWAKSREMASRTGAHFTYFLSCTFAMNADARKAYQGPHHKPGKSNIGFARSDEEVRTRLDHIWNAHLEGHDIGSHACGHFDGKDWSKADWLAEFSTARSTLLAAWGSVGLADKQPEGWETFVKTDIRGFRAPYLSTSPGLIDAEREAGFLYDASLVTKGPMLPVAEGGIQRFGLPLIPEGPNKRPVIGMDYNLFVRHSSGIEDKARSSEYEERAYTAYKAAFDKQYDGDRIPLQLGFHFVEMNGGAYWRALDRLLGEVCRRDDVACVSYSEALPLIAARQTQKKAEPGSAF